jgi:hypothetical protein
MRRDDQHRRSSSQPSFGGRRDDDVKGLADSDPRQRVRPAARRGRELLRLVEERRARGAGSRWATHGVELFAIACPDISYDTARDIAAFCKG